MYLWGSIITSDFDERISDIDSIAIVAGNFQEIYESQIQEFLAKNRGKMKKFGFRILYLNDLNGIERRSFLSSVIDPKLLLQDMPWWEFIAGKHFSQNEFLLPVPTVNDALEIRKGNLRDCNWIILSQIPERECLQFLKMLARIINLNQQKRGFCGVFSYSSLESNATKNTIEWKTARAILKIRMNHWDYNEFIKYSNLFQDYVDTEVLKMSN